MLKFTIPFKKFNQMQSCNVRIQRRFIRINSKLSCKISNKTVVITTVKNFYSILTYYQHKKLTVVQKKKFKRKLRNESSFSQFTAMETSVFTPDSKHRYPLSNLTTRFSFFFNKDKKNLFFPRKFSSPVKENEVEWHSPKVDKTTEFNSLWTKPFQTNPFLTTLSSKTKVLRSIEINRQSHWTLKNKSILKQPMDENKVIEPIPGIFFKYNTRNTFIYNFVYKPIFCKNIRLIRHTRIRIHSLMQRTFVKWCSAKRLFFRKKYKTRILQQIQQYKKKTKYNKFKFITAIINFYRLAKLNYSFIWTQSKFLFNKNVSTPSLILRNKGVSETTEFFNGSIFKTLFFKKETNFFQLKAKRWRRRRKFFFFKKKWTWCVQSGKWKFFEEQPTFFIPPHRFFFKQKKTQLITPIFFLKKFIHRWTKKKDLYNIFWSDSGVFCRSSSRKTNIGFLAFKKKILFPRASSNFFFNNSPMANVFHPSKLKLFNIFMNWPKPHALSQKIHSKLKNKLDFKQKNQFFFEKMFMYNNKINNSISIKLSSFSPSYQAMSLYYFTQQRKRNDFNNSILENNRRNFSEENVFFIRNFFLSNSLQKNNFYRSNFFSFFDQKSKVKEKTWRTKENFFSKAISALSYIPERYGAVKKKEKIIQRYLRKQCSIAVALKAKKRQDFIDQNIRAQAILREEAERNSPKIIESEEEKKIKDRMQAFIDQTVTQFMEQRWYKNQFSSTSSVLTQNFFSRQQNNVSNSMVTTNFSNFSTYQGLNFLTFQSSLFMNSKLFTLWKKKSITVAISSFASRCSDFAMFKGNWSFPPRDLTPSLDLDSEDKNSYQEMNTFLETERDFVFKGTQNTENYHLFFSSLIPYANNKITEYYSKYPFQPYFNWETFFKQNLLRFTRSTLSWYYITVIVTPRRNNLWVTVIPLIARSPKIITYRRIFHYTAGMLVEQKGKLRRSPETKKDLYAAAAFRLLRFSKKKSNYKFLIFKLPHFFQCLGKAKNYASVYRMVQSTFRPFLSSQLRERLPLAEVFAPKTRPTYWGARLRGQPRRARKHKPQIKKVSYL